MIENLIPYDYSRTKSSICAALQKPEQLTVSNLWRLEDFSEVARHATCCSVNQSDIL